MNESPWLTLTDIRLSWQFSFPLRVRAVLLSEQDVFEPGGDCNVLIRRGYGERQFGRATQFLVRLKRRQEACWRNELKVFHACEILERGKALDR